MHAHWIGQRQELKLKCFKYYYIYLREGANVLSAEVVQLLVNPALPYMLVTTDRLRQEMLLGFLQLEITHTLLDLPQNRACHRKIEVCT